MRANLALKQKGKCHYCDEPTDSSDAKKQPTIDHRTPRHNGGRYTHGNPVMACWECNNTKGPLTEAEFFAAYRLGGLRLVRKYALQIHAQINKRKGTHLQGGKLGKCNPQIFIDGPPDRGAVTPPHLRLRVRC